MIPIKNLLLFCAALLTSSLPAAVSPIHPLKQLESEFVKKNADLEHDPEETAIQTNKVSLIPIYWGRVSNLLQQMRIKMPKDACLSACATHVKKFYKQGNFDSLYTWFSATSSQNRQYLVEILQSEEFKVYCDTEIAKWRKVLS